MKIWIYFNGVQNGPYELEQLPNLPVTATTPVWHEGMSDWLPASKAPATKDFFRHGNSKPVKPQSNNLQPVKETVVKEEVVETVMVENPSNIETASAIPETIEDAVEKISISEPTDEEKSEILRLAEEEIAEKEIIENTADEVLSGPQEPTGEEKDEILRIAEEGAAVCEEEETLSEEEVKQESASVETVCAETPVEPAPRMGERIIERVIIREKEVSPAVEPEDEKLPPAYLPWNIVLTCLCCTPLSIAGIITGVVTLSARRKGNLAKARKWSSVTEWLVILAITFGIMSPFIYMMIL